MKTQIILMIIGILLVGTLVYLILDSKPSQIYPLSGMIIYDKEFAFEFENAEQVILSTSYNFSNIIELNKGEKIDLPPGTYYWKVRSILGESKTRNFTITSKVSINLGKNNNSLIVSNTGNVELNITKKKDGENSSSFVLDENENKEIEANSSLEARKL